MSSVFQCWYGFVVGFNSRVKAENSFLLGNHAVVILVPSAKGGGGAIAGMHATRSGGLEAVCSHGLLLPPLYSI